MLATVGEVGLLSTWETTLMHAVGVRERQEEEASLSFGQWGKDVSGTLGRKTGLWLEGGRKTEASY